MTHEKGDNSEKTKDLEKEYQCNQYGRQTLESKGFRPGKTKTNYMRCDISGAECEEAEVILEGQIVPKRDTF